ncbi:MAG: hypothetical protein MJK14_11305, partial [Rivularia sp. ALOHA_DT_140]|nr:hypothetical protein [Rivularia sp. ALOHA_DT_140]
MAQPQVTHALFDVEVGKIAKDITVKIDNEENRGAGIIINKSGNTYTILTASHVIKDKSKYEIATSDKPRQPVPIPRPRFERLPAVGQPVPIPRPTIETPPVRQPIPIPPPRVETP